MIHPLARIFALVLALVSLAGCASVDPATPNPISIDPLEYPRVYDAAILVLREHGFVPARQDYRFGRIVTQPRVAPTALEPWNDTNTTADQHLQASLTHQRRIVTVFLDPASSSESSAPASPVITPASPSTPGLIVIPPPGGMPATQPLSPAQPGAAQASAGPTPASYNLRVQVIIEQRQLPQQRLTGSMDGHSIVDSLAENPAEYRQRGIAGAYWQPLGTDPQLEKRLLAQIINRSITLQRRLPQDENPPAETQPANTQPQTQPDTQPRP